MPWCPCPFKIEASGTSILIGLELQGGHGLPCPGLGLDFPKEVPF